MKKTTKAYRKIQEIKNPERVLNPKPKINKIKKLKNNKLIIYNNKRKKIKELIEKL